MLKNVKPIYHFRGWNGPDCSPEISLLEYGMLWRYDKRTKEYVFVHTCSHGQGFTLSRYKADIDVYKEFGWVDDWTTMLHQYGIEQDEFDKLDLPSKIYMLVGYWGTENIFGTDYYIGFYVSDNNGKIRKNDYED